MELKSWLEAESGRAVKLAKALTVYPSFISKIANGKKPVPFEKCMPIERATEGAVTRRDLRPDDYHIHWPELACVQPAAPCKPITPQEHFACLADGLTLQERRIGPPTRRLKQQPFTGPDQRVGPADRRGFKLPEVTAVLPEGL